jgi:hypothetical protein
MRQEEEVTSIRAYDVSGAEMAERDRQKRRDREAKRRERKRAKQREREQQEQRAQMKAESDRDISNVEAWAVIIEDNRLC